MEDTNWTFSPQHYKEDFSPTEEYIELFKKGYPLKISFLDETNEDLEKGTTKLGEIFTINKNSWVGQIKLKPFVERLEELECSLYKELVKGKLSIHEFKYDEPKGPEKKEEQYIFNRLKDHSKAKSFNVQWLYWRAYHFFKSYNLHLQLESVCMGLGEKDCINRRKDEYIDAESCIETSSKHYQSLVRCGELEIERLYREIYSGTKFIWVFPFDEELYVDDDEVVCSTIETKAYLLQITEDAMKTLLEKRARKYQKIIF